MVFLFLFLFKSPLSLSVFFFSFGIPYIRSMEQTPTTTLPFVGGAKQPVPQHPIGPLTAAEITRSASLVRAFWPANTDLQFKAITLVEPPKAELLPYLQAERRGEKPAPLERRGFVIYYIRNTVSEDSPEWWGWGGVQG